MKELLNALMVWIKTCGNCNQTFSGKTDKAPENCPGCGHKW